MGGPYRGPDRRPSIPPGAHDRSPVVLAAAGGAGAAALVDAATGPDAQAALAAVVGAAPLVVATVLLLCAWRVGGRARPAHAAVALALAGGTGPLVAWLATSAAPAAATAPVTAVALAAGLLAAVPHAGAASRGAEVDTDLRPAAAVLAGSGLVLAAGAGAAALAGMGWLPALPPPASLGHAPWAVAWPAVLGSASGTALVLAARSLRSSLSSQRLRGLRAVAGLQRSAADAEHDRARRHDARSALAAVRAASAVLTGEQPGVLDPAAQRALAAALRSELGRVERLLGDGPPAAGPDRPGVVDLREALTPLVAAWRARGLDLTGPPPGPPVHALGHPDAVRRAVSNLLDNAARHAPGAAVTLSVSAGGHDDDGAALLVVHDDGPGVPAVAREAVFRPGARLSQATPGQGLGLASARTLAEADGGSLRLVESDRGARFELRLPVPADLPADLPEEVTAR
ncbi:sensor histidine kinase [Quadrisphaera setariae]|uniref:histidine kinase n=1 Tax=Quadrisphaera setariae TaxID=2593304 RepID=A0A5C8Z3Z1_9ACTN|nr:HAMP domain-containing sensor histidine kinase [Quadrisphaera setariae]TXR52277.1 HAMP domain-containing histidine kinase [Quadrisphaera setariae]